MFIAFVFLIANLMATFFSSLNTKLCQIVNHVQATQLYYNPLGCRREMTINPKSVYNTILFPFIRILNSLSHIEICSVQHLSRLGVLSEQLRTVQPGVCRSSAPRQRPK